MTYDIHKLSFGYSSDRVLHGVSIRIEPGEFIAIVGPNGAGKSTLLKLLAGLLSHFEGSIDFMGQPIESYNPAGLARKIAFVPQETHVVFPFTVDEIILMGRVPYRQSFLFDTEEDARFVRKAMAATQTEDLAGKMFNMLSGGERQRVVLASALAQTPEVLLLDEPTVYLDIKHQFQFYEILERLKTQENMTIVAVTHDINLAARYAPRMIAIREGVSIADGTPDDLLTAEKLYEIFGITADVVDRPQGGKYIIPSA